MQFCMAVRRTIEINCFDVIWLMEKEFTTLTRLILTVNFWNNQLNLHIINLLRIVLWPCEHRCLNENLAWSLISLVLIQLLINYQIYVESIRWNSKELFHLFHILLWYLNVELLNIYVHTFIKDFIDFYKWNWLIVIFY